MQHICCGEHYIGYRRHHPRGNHAANRSIRQTVLLPLGGVPRLGGLLGRAPPGLVVAVPRDRLGQAGGEVGMRGLPAELGPELGGVDRVAAVVAGAVAHPVEVVLRAAEGLEDLAQHRDVVQLAVGADQVGLPDAAAGQNGPDGGAVVLGVDPVADVLEDLAQHRDVVQLAVGADQVGLPDAAAGQNGPDGGAVVLGVDPVADVAPVAVELGADAVDEIRDLARDELLHVLVGAVVVGAVGDGGPEAEGAGPGAHQQVGGSLGGAVRGARAVGRLLGEAGRVVERQVAVDLVGGDVVVAHAVLPAGLDQGVGALDVGPEERRGVGDGVVVVGLGGVVDHGVGLRHEAVDERGVADVAHDELDAVRGQARDVVGVAGVGQLVEHGHVDARVLAHDVVDEVGADEGDGGREAEGAGPGADQQVRARLGGAVRGARAVGSLLGAAGRVVQRQGAVDLVGGDVVVARAVPAAGLDEGVGALDVGLEERARVGDGVVVVGLGGVVDDGVGPRDQAVDERGVADVAHHELDAVGGQPGDVVGVAGVGQLVEHGDVDARVLSHDVVDEVGADEAAAAGDDDPLKIDLHCFHYLTPSISFRLLLTLQNSGACQS